MRVSFVEAMQGVLRDRDGREAPISFEIEAAAPRLGGFLLDGRTEVLGVVHASPFAEEASLRGTLEISPWAGTIAYRLRFPGVGGELTLSGEKRPTPRGPLRSMTRMDVSLRGPGGELLAEGVMRFELGDLRAFLVSWLPWSRGAQRRLGARRRAVERRTLDGPRPAPGPPEPREEGVRS